MQVKYIILAVTGFCIYAFTNAGLEFGSFDLLITDFQQCKGPKRRDCCDINSTIIELHKLDYHLYVKENVKTTKIPVYDQIRNYESQKKVMRHELKFMGKLVATTQGKDSLRLQLKNPCEHLFMRPLFQSIMNVTKDCVIMKGYYHFHLDILEVADKYYSGGFIYGQWKFMSVFYNDYCNFSCSNIVVEIVPKKSKNKTLSHSSK